MDGNGGCYNNSSSEELRLERLRIKAKHDIGEVEAHIPERINQLKKIIIEGDASIVIHPPIYDEFYLRCIRARKYDLQRAAKLYKKFCTLRHGSAADMISNLIPSHYAPHYDNKLCSILHSRDTRGRHVFIIRVEKFDAKETTFDDFLSCLFLLLDEITALIDTQLHGIVVIGDLKTLSLAHAKLVRPGKLQTVASILQDSYPARFKEFHCINNPYVFNMIYSIAKPFLKEKMRKRIHFHGESIESLHKALSIDPKILPEFLGGNVSEDDYADFDIIDRLVQKDYYYKDFFKYGFSCK